MPRTPPAKTPPQESEDERVEQESGDEEADDSSQVDNPLNASLTSTQSVVMFPSTVQMQQDIMVLSGNFIFPEEAEDFYEQALRCPNLKINECMKRSAIQVLNVKIMCDQDIAIIDRRDRHDW